MIAALGAYKKTYNRALYLLRLGFGITNHRQKKIRSDWRKSFCRFMRWPISTRIERVDSKDAIVILREKSFLHASAFDEEDVSELYRAALVLSVSAIDTYFHHKILEQIRMIDARNLPESLLKWEFKKSLGDLIGKACWKVSTKKRLITMLVEEKIGYLTYQRPDKISEGLKLINIKKFWKRISKKLKLPESQLKSRIEQVVSRRDRIVHEGDIIKKRGRYTGKSRSLTHSQAYKWCLYINNFIEASESIVNESKRSGRRA